MFLFQIMESKKDYNTKLLTLRDRKISIIDKVRIMKSRNA